jgi:CMP/dCMP kinase
MGWSAVDLITVSREYGAGGSDLARALGERLRWPVLDRDLVQRVAERLRLDPRAVEAQDEHPPSLFARLSAAMLITPPELPLSLDTSSVLSPDAVAEAARAAILAAAETPPLVVVGHGSQALFQERRRTLHVRLVAPLDVRVRRICRRAGCNPAFAAVQARRMDEDRAAYVRRYYHAEWRDPLLYDLQINTARVSAQQAADMIVGLLGGSAAQPAGTAPASTGAPDEAAR